MVLNSKVPVTAPTAAWGFGLPAGVLLRGRTRNYRSIAWLAQHQGFQGLPCSSSDCVLWYRSCTERSVPKRECHRVLPPHSLLMCLHLCLSHRLEVWNGLVWHAIRWELSRKSLVLKTCRCAYDLIHMNRSHKLPFIPEWGYVCSPVFVRFGPKLQFRVVF